MVLPELGAAAATAGTAAAGGGGGLLGSLGSFGYGLGSLGSGLAGIFGQGGPTRNFGQSRKRARQVLLDMALPLQEQLYGKAESEVRKIPLLINKARGELQSGFQAGATGLVDEGQRRLSDIRAGLLNSGFSTGSLMENARQGVGLNTARALADLEGRMAEMQVGLTGQEIDAKARLAALFQQRDQAQSNLLQQYAGIVSAYS